MDVFWSIVGLIVIVILGIFLRASVEKAERKRGVRLTSLGKYVCGIPGIAGGETVTIHLYDDRVTFKDHQTISINRIRKCAIMRYTQLEIKEMPAKLQPKATDKFLVIDYVNVQGAEVRAVLLMLTPSSSIAVKINEGIGYAAPGQRSETNRNISFPHEV